MKIVAAPDSFKGSISARELCQAIRKGIENVRSDAEVIELPLADGGEGTMENMVYSTQGKTVECEATDPLRRRIRASYGVLGDGQTVVVEVAQASGLTLLREGERDPLRATSYGTGELIRHALDAGYRRFIIGLGGSATNDGGAGLLRSLGLKFYHHDGSLLADGGAPLRDLAFIDTSEFDPRIKDSHFTIASDVTNPLCGGNGASAVFGPQKGATPENVVELDQALERYALVIFEQTGFDVRELPGSGAAGGIGAALLSFFHAECRSGIEIVMEAIGFNSQIQDADFIITGEGRLDTQTLSGKVIAGVCKEAKVYQVPVIALCGGMQLTREQMDQMGLLAGFSIIPRPCSLDVAMENASRWAESQVEQIMRLLSRKEKE
ncbi:glycerate kinase [Ammoniphilus sp. CFH 90114]|uniref:glycerate kinase n=1 Tax=Ammoniphilus sp. CFH 90114 TaxID=2493665 RepID=UPI00100F2F5A|nr:glycerate kinase [Ammoniphilus sp. CFH 90114]RXT04533.1 glycerate kinase [Ammoniphilus sp. CFH 90114]